MEIEVKINNRLGLHARPAALIAKCASRFEAQILLTPTDGNFSADAKSILSLLMLGAPCGSIMKLAADGADAEDALTEIGKLFESKFDEE